MAAQKGNAVLIKIAVTNKDSAGIRTLLAGGGVQSMSISGSGVFTDTAAEGALRTQFGAAALLACSFIIPDLGTYAGNFQLTSLEYAGEYNGEATYSLSFESGAAA